MREGNRLLVVEDRSTAIADAVAMQNRIHSEFKIFSEQMELPSLVPLHHLAGEHESRTAHVARGAENHTRVRQESRFTDEPQRRTRRHPVIRQIHRITVAGQNLESGAERLVHFLEVVLVQLVIGIEHEVGLIIIGRTDVEHMPQQIRQRISLANQFKIVAFHHMAAQRPHHVGGVVGAVVGHQPDVDEVGRVGLIANRPNKVADHFFFVARGDQHGIPVGHRGVGEAHGLGEQGHHDTQSLIYHAGTTDDYQKNIEY